MMRIDERIHQLSPAKRRGIAAIPRLAGAVTLWWSNPVGVLLLVFALQSFWRSGVQVLIDGEAVRIRRTPLGRKGTVIPLSQVEAAEVDIVRRDFWKGLEADHHELDPRSVSLGPGHVLCSSAVDVSPWR